MEVRRNRISLMNQITAYVLGIAISAGCLSAHRAFADADKADEEKETEFQRVGALFAEFKPLSSGKIQVRACEVLARQDAYGNYYYIDECSLAGRESGYTFTELNDQANRLNAKANRSLRIKTLSRLIGIGIGILGGAPLGVRGIGFTRNAKGDLKLAQDSYGPSILGLVVGGAAGAGLGSGAGYLTALVINAAKNLDDIRDSDAAKLISVARIQVDDDGVVTLKNRLNYALMGIPDSQSESTCPAVTSSGAKGTSAPPVAKIVSTETQPAGANQNK